MVNSVVPGDKQLIKPGGISGDAQAVPIDMMSFINSRVKYVSFLVRLRAKTVDSSRSKRA